MPLLLFVYLINMASILVGVFGVVMAFTHYNFIVALVCTAFIAMLVKVVYEKLDELADSIRIKRRLI